MNVNARFAGLLASALLAGCSGSNRGDDRVAQKSETGRVPEYEQRAGDPALGLDALLNEAYIECGIPWSTYDELFGPAPESLRVPGRDPRNESLPFYFTAYTSLDTGTELVTANCLGCHAGFFNGELIVGLGDDAGDFTDDLSFPASALSAFVPESGPERIEYERWNDRVQAIAPYSRTDTIGINPAENLTYALLAHRDPETLAWSNQLLLDPPPEYVLPVSVPPWWRMSKKHAMFYHSMGRGDHARIMMTASNLCTDSVERAQAIDDYFTHVRAWIASLEAPVWPFGAIDAAQAARGRSLFRETCSRCHGTYGESGEDKYPNLVVPLAEIGTDPALAIQATEEIDRFLLWNEDSFYGEVSDLAPAPGYVAPPLDGVWATAPYLHNGSVPTIEALLRSELRPTYWTRDLYDSTAYDPATLGWIFTELPYGKDGVTDPDLRKAIYDTTRLGASNAGHTFGDALTDDERAAVLEYLKTL